jgi:hypothetical protein
LIDEKERASPDLHHFVQPLTLCTLLFSAIVESAPKVLGDWNKLTDHQHAANGVNIDP